MYALKMQVLISGIYILQQGCYDAVWRCNIMYYYISSYFMSQVTGIVGRADVLACIFFLLSFLAYHGWVWLKLL